MFQCQHRSGCCHGYCIHPAAEGPHSRGKQEAEGWGQRHSPGMGIAVGSCSPCILVTEGPAAACISRECFNCCIPVLVDRNPTRSCTHQLAEVGTHIDVEGTSSACGSVWSFPFPPSLLLLPFPPCSLKPSSAGTHIPHRAVG